MSALTWPCGLPLPDLGSPALQPDGAQASTGMESGAVRDRRLFEHLPGEYAATVTLGVNHGTVLMAFYQRVGTSPFDMQAVLPFGLQRVQTVTARFLAAPVPTEQSQTRTGWAIRLFIDGLAALIPDQADLDFLMVYGDEAREADGLYHAIISDLSDQLSALSFSAV